MRHKAILSSAASIVAVYVAVGGAWITLSDRVLLKLVPELHRFTWFSTVKGWLFVCITGVILYIVLKRYVSRLEDLRDNLEERVEEKTADLVRTVDTLHDEVRARREAEEIQRRHFWFLQVLLDATSVPIFWKNAQGRYLGCNTAFGTFLGRGKDQIIGKTVYEIAPKEFADIYYQKDEELFVTPGVQVYESSMVPADGVRHNVIFNKATFFNEDGSVGGLVGTILDITERKRTEEALQKAYDELELRVAERTAELRKLNESLERQIVERKQIDKALQDSEAFLRRVIDATPSMVFVKDWDGHFLLVNESLARYYGTTIEGIVGKTDADFNSDVDEVAHFLRDDREVMSTRRQKLILEEPVTGADGQTRWFSTVKVALTNEDGTCNKVLGVATDITQRKLAHESLEREIAEHKIAEEKIRNLAKIPSENPYPIIRIAWDGKVLYANEVSEPYLAQWGMQVGSVAPENIRKVMGEAVDTCVKQEIELTHSGRVFSFAVAPIMDSYYCNFYGRDVTESKQAEEEIRAREAQFRTLVEASLNALLMVAVDGTIKLVNRQAETLFGYRREELVGQSIEILVPERFRHKHPRLRTDYAASPEPRLMGMGRDLFAVRKDGTEVPVEIGLSPIETPEGFFTLATIIDITRRKHAELELHKVNQSLRALSQCNEIMVRMTQEQDFLNGVCTSIVAYGGYRLVWVGFAEHDKNEIEIVRPAAYAGYEGGYLKAVEIRWDDSERGRGPAGTAIRTGKPCICGNIPTDPMYAPWRDEAIRRGYISTMALPLIDSGTTLGALSIYSPQPNAFGDEEVELLMELANDMAYGINSIRARKERERAEAASQRLNRELVRKNKELESIIFVASHDLRSALVNVQGFSRELGMTSEVVRTALSRKDIPQALKEQLQKPLEEDIPEAVDFITNSTAKIDALLNGLLRLSRVGREEMKIVRLDVNAMIAEIIRNVHVRLVQANARVEVGPLPACMGDYSLVSQVFLSLIDNSIKFLDKTRQGLIRISGAKEEGRAVYCVEDNGIGIEPEYQSKVFEVFQRLVPDEAPGEGLGLAIVRQIVERHNGRVWIESMYGKGSKFFVSLPSD